MTGATVRFTKTWSRGTPRVLLLAPVAAIVAFAIVGLTGAAGAASRSSASPTPIRCVTNQPLKVDEPPACPVQGQTVVVAPISGKVFVTAPGRARVRFDEPHTIPVTSIVDARQGRYRLTADQRSIGIRFATADFYGGRAEIVQGLGAKGATVRLQLAGGNFGICGSGARAIESRSHRKVQHLWGNGKGHFGISGQYASAIVRGTNWRVTDYCDGSGVTVRRGTVAVNDFATGQTVLVTAGHSFFAAAVAATFVFPTECPTGNVPLGSQATISGKFTPPQVSPAPQVDYTAPSGAVTRHTLSLDPQGNFADQVTANERGIWKVSVHLANAAPGGTPGSCSFVVT
jgi:hypothetical protein